MKALLIQSIVAALRDVEFVGNVMRRDRRTPGRKIHIGFLASQADRALEIYEKNLPGFRTHLACLDLVQIVNERITTMGDLEMSLAQENPDRRVREQLHLQIPVAMGELGQLEAQLRAIYRELDSEAAAASAAKREVRHQEEMAKPPLR